MRERRESESQELRHKTEPNSILLFSDQTQREKENINGRRTEDRGGCRR